VVISVILQEKEISSVWTQISAAFAFDEISRPAARSLVLLLLTVFFFPPNAVSEICFVAFLFSEISSSPSADSGICLPRYLFSDIFFPHKNKSPEVRYLETHCPVF